MRSTWKRGCLFTAGAILAVLAGTLTWASAHGGDTTQIHGCVVRTSGYVRIVGANDNCKKGETPLDWNIQGPQGPQGIQGIEGIQGDAGNALSDLDDFVGLGCATTEGEDGVTDAVVGVQVSSTSGYYVHSVAFSCKVAWPANGTPCDDGNGATRDDVFTDGTCLGAPITCDDGDPNTVDSWNQTLQTCEFTPIR